MPNLWLMSSSRVCWNLCIYHVKDSRPSLKFHFFMHTHTHTYTKVHLTAPVPWACFWTQLEFLVWNLCNARLANKRMVEGFMDKGRWVWVEGLRLEGQCCWGAGRGETNTRLFSRAVRVREGRRWSLTKWCFCPHKQARCAHTPVTSAPLHPPTPCFNVWPWMPPLFQSRRERERNRGRVGERAKQEWWVFGMRRNGWRSILSCLYLE